MTLYRNEITLVVLSEELVNDWTIEQIVRECVEGQLVAHSMKIVAQEQTGKQMSDLLYEAGSDPNFFNLDDNGQEVNE